MLRVKTITVRSDAQEPFDAQINKAISGLNVKSISYAYAVGEIEIRTALILYEA